MSKQTVTYGQFSFPFTRVAVTESPVYSSDGTMLESTRYEFNVSGWLTAPTIEDFNALLIKMRCQLREPRQALELKWAPEGGGDNIYYSFSPSFADDDFGPKPGELTINTFSGGV